MSAALIVAEPHPAYVHRPKLVVDASVVAALVFLEQNRSDAASWLRGRALCAPHLLHAEIAGAGANQVRRRRQSPDAVLEMLSHFEAMEIDRYVVPPSGAFEIAQRYGLSTYDASYLWLAASLGAPLATFDARLGEAAKKHLAGGERPG